MDSKKLRNSLGLFATGVMIASTSRLDLEEPQFCGMTINSFASLSLDPPLVLFSIDNKSSNLEFFSKNDSFSLNILSDNQVNLAKAFATPKNEAKWQVESYYLGKMKNPIFHNSLAFFECQKHRVIKEGDHHIIIGKVIDFAKINESKPLTYYNSDFSTIAS